MNKGFAYYFKKAFKTAMQTICKNKNILQSMLYFFTSLVARLTVFLGAMPALADVKQAKIAKTERTIDIPQSFTNASRRPFWTMTVATLLEIFIYLGGFLLVSVACGVIFAIGLAITQFVTSSANVIIIIFSVPCLIIYLVYTIIVIAMFAPTAYVVDTNPELSAGEVVSVCVNSMKNRGKLTVFLCVFIPSLIVLLIAGVFGAGFYLVLTMLKGKSFMPLIVILLAVVAIVVLGFLLPIFTMTKNIALVALFEDIALDPVNASKRTANINIKKISGARVDREEVADNLNALFDDSIEEKTPEPEELVHRHKKKKRQPVKPASEPAPAPSPAPQPLSDGAEAVTFEEVDDYADELPKPSEQTEQAQQPVQTERVVQPVQPEQPIAHEQPAPAQPAQSAPQGQPAPAQPEQPAQAQQAQRPYPNQQVPPVQGQPAQRPYPNQQVPPMQGQQAQRPYPNQQVPPMQGQQAQRPYPNQQVPPMPGQQAQRPYPNQQVPPMSGQPMQGQPAQRPVPPRPPQGNGPQGNGNG